MSLKEGGGLWKESRSQEVTHRGGATWAETAPCWRRVFQMQKTIQKTLALSECVTFGGKITLRVQYCWSAHSEEDVLNRLGPYPNRRSTYSM